MASARIVSSPETDGMSQIARVRSIDEPARSRGMAVTGSPGLLLVLLVRGLAKSLAESKGFWGTLLI
jgi:hypothetical protein